MADVDLRFFASQDEAEKAWQNQLRKAEQLKIKLQEVSHASKQGGQVATQSGEAMGGSFFKAGLQLQLIARGWDAVKQGIQGAVELQRKYMADVDATARKRTEESLKLQIQGGLTPAAVRQQIPMIEKELLAMPSTDVSGGIRLQTQLASSGFKNEDVKSGEALRAVLELKGATNQFGNKEFGDEAEAVQSLSMWAKANGAKNPGAGDVRRMGAKVTEMFKDTDLQFPHLKELAGEASTMKLFNMSENEQLAAFSTMVDVKAPGEAATGMRQFVQKLGTVKGDKTREKALSKLGLKPSQVDFVGESFTDVLSLMSGKMAGKSEDQRNAILSDIYGEKAISSAALMMDPGKIELIKERTKQLEDPKEYQNNIRAFRESRYARGQKPKIRKEIAEREADQKTGQLTWDETNDIQAMFYAEEMQRAQGPGQRTATTARHYIGQAGTWLGRSIGMTPEDMGITARDRAQEREASEEEERKGEEEASRKRVMAAAGSAHDESTRENWEARFNAEHPDEAAGEAAQKALLAAQAGVKDLEANPRFTPKYAQASVQTASAAVEAMPASAERDAAAARLAAVMERLEKALDKNTEATAANSRSGGGRAPVSLPSQRLSRG